MAQKRNKSITRKQQGTSQKNINSAKPFDKNLLWVLAILVLTFISLYPALKCEFTNWDDNVYLNENTLLTSLSANNIKKIFSIDNPVSLNYHPLTILSLAIDYHFSKLAPFRYHLVNLILHLLNTMLVFVFIYKLSRQRIFVALAVSLFFAIHPMHVESVAWIAERKDVLYTFFFIGGLITYLQYLESKKTGFFILTFLLFILSVLSKAMAVVFPLVLLLLDYYKARKMSLKALAEKIPFFIISVLAGWLTLRIQSRSAIAAYELFTLPQRLSFGFYGFITYIWKMFLPVHLSAFYPYPITDIYGKIPPSFYIIALCGLLVFLSVAILSFLKKEKIKLLTFGVAFYFITIVMVLQFLSVGQVIMADRYSYIPYIGLFFILAMLLNDVMQKKPVLKTPVTIFIIAVAVLFSFMTNARTQVWQNSETLWTDVQEKYPFPPWTIEVAYENRGNYYAKEHNELDRGLADYNTILKMNTKNYNIFKNIGNIYGLKGQEAAKAGDTKKAQEFTDKAIDSYNTAITLNDKDADVFINLAITYSNMNRYDLAALNYGKAIKLRPEDLSLIERQAIAYFNSGNIKEAIADFNLQTQQDPQNANAWFNLSACYNQLGDKSNALADAEKAQQLGHPVDQKYLDGLRNAATK